MKYVKPISRNKFSHGIVKFLNNLLINESKDERIPLSKEKIGALIGVVRVLLRNQTTKIKNGIHVVHKSFKQTWVFSRIFFRVVHPNFSLCQND